jgi:hypothetical protein
MVSFSRKGAPTQREIAPPQLAARCEKPPFFVWTAKRQINILSRFNQCAEI